MKKICFIFALFFSILTCSALDVSFSDQGVDMDANVVKKGNLVYLKYTIGGLNSPEMKAQMPAGSEGIAEVSEMNIDMIMSCSNKKMKLNSMKMLSPDGSVVQEISNTEWFPIEKQEDLNKLKEMCNTL